MSYILDGVDNTYPENAVVRQDEGYVQLDRKNQIKRIGDDNK